jgi:hypothetical protein
MWNIIGAIVFFILGYAAHVALPYLKLLIEKLVKKGYDKADAEIDRWH